MAESTQRQPNGRFKKGHLRIVGRVKGEPNKISRSLREGILDAAIEHGSDGNGKDGLKGCASWLLREHTKSFMPLLVRLLPLQVSGEVNHRTTKLHVNIVNVPRGRHFTADEARKVLAGDTSPLIDVTPASTADDFPPRIDEVEEPSPHVTPHASSNNDAASVPMMALVVNKTGQDE